MRSWNPSMGESEAEGKRTRGAVRYILHTPVRSVGQASASLQAFGLLYSSGKGLTQGMWARARASNGFRDYKR